MTPLAVTIAASAVAFTLGVLVGYLVRRPPGRRSSIESRPNGGSDPPNRGWHRRR